MPDLDLLRELAPPVEPPSPDAVRETRRRVSARSRRRQRPFRRRLLVAAPLAVAAVLALAVVGSRLDGTRLDGTAQRAWAAEAVRAAEASPRLLLTGDGWQVTRVDEWSVGTGEMSFENGAAHVDLRWSDPAEGAVAVKREPGDDEMHTTVLGAEVSVVRYADTDAYRAVWRDGGSDLVAQGSAASPEAFVALLHGLERVSVDAWLSALPAAAITPAEHDVAVGEMLQGMPLPPGVQAADLEAETDATRDRYQLGARVVSVVACGWISSWVEAWAADDVDAQQAAMEAMASSRTWPILLEMNADGDYPEAVWELADAMANGGQRVIGERTKAQQEALERKLRASAEVSGLEPADAAKLRAESKILHLGVAETYESALGCGQ